MATVALLDVYIVEALARQYDAVASDAADHPDHTGDGFHGAAVVDHGHRPKEALHAEGMERTSGHR